MSDSAPVETPSAADPSFHSAPAYNRTYGDEVADLCEAVGYGPYPEQRLLLDDTFAIGKRGKSAAFESAVVCTRQQMKTGFLKQAAIGWMFLMDQRLVVWSAHEFSTAAEALRDLSEIVEGSSMLSRRVKQIYHGNTNPSIELMSGARLLFKARTSAGGRGLTGHKVILDEAFALQAAHLGALLPTMSSRAVPDGQVVYASSAGLASSAILRGVRDRGRVGGARLAYSEWGAPERECEIQGCQHIAGSTPGCALDDRDLWAIANPVSYRHDPSLEMVGQLRASMPPEEFARECLGWWDDPADASLQGLDVAKWAAQVDPNSRRSGGVAFGIDMSADRSTVNIAAFGARDDGHRHIELIESRRGTSWVGDRLLELQAKHAPRAIVIDPGGPLASLIPDLERAGVQLTLVTAGEYAAACGRLNDLLEAGEVYHREEHRLDAAVGGSKAHRLTRGGWVWRPRSEVSISPLIAATLALHGWEFAAGDPSMNVW